MVCVLVITASDVSADEAESAIGDRFGESPEIHVVAPASSLSRLEWLTNAEDDARAEAAERAVDIAKALPVADVQAHVGDSDPLQAIDDALRMFTADQIVVVTRDGDEASWLESGTVESARERFDVPVSHVVV